MPVNTVAMLTAGGLAPCLSSAVGGLIERYTEIAPDVRIIAYRNGYAGLLTGDSVEVTPEVRANAYRLHAFGGTPIGNRWSTNAMNAGNGSAASPVTVW